MLAVAVQSAYGLGAFSRALHKSSPPSLCLYGRAGASKGASAGLQTLGCPAVGLSLRPGAQILLRLGAPFSQLF